MFKDRYLKALLKIEEAVGCSGKFEFDKVLDGYYDFNMNEAAAFFEMIKIVETMAAGDCREKPSFRFRNGTYRISRIAGEQESIVIYGCSLGECEGSMTENELMKRIDQKCTAKEQLYTAQIMKLKKMKSEAYKEV